MTKVRSITLRQFFYLLCDRFRADSYPSLPTIRFPNRPAPLSQYPKTAIAGHRRAPIARCKDVFCSET